MTTGLVARVGFLLMGEDQLVHSKHPKQDCSEFTHILEKMGIEHQFYHRAAEHSFTHKYSKGRLKFIIDDSPAPTVSGEPVAAWQVRHMRADNQWLGWMTCTEESFNAWRRDPSYRNGRTELRCLYTREVDYSDEVTDEQLAELRRMVKPALDAEEWKVIDAICCGMDPARGEPVAWRWRLKYQDRDEWTDWQVTASRRDYGGPDVRIEEHPLYIHSAPTRAEVLEEVAAAISSDFHWTLPVYPEGEYSARTLNEVTDDTACSVQDQIVAFVRALKGDKLGTWRTVEKGEVSDNKS